MVVRARLAALITPCLPQVLVVVLVLVLALVLVLVLALVLALALALVLVLALVQCIREGHLVRCVESTSTSPVDQY